MEQNCGCSDTLKQEIDTIDAEEYFFEGTEKLLEIWFDDDSKDDTSLRNIGKFEWEELLMKVNCSILNSIKSPKMDSYLLSESSLFVSKDRIILKTCGKITLLEAVQPLLGMARKRGFHGVADVFYSHKNYLRPDLQPETYKHFDQEAATLDRIFDQGASHTLGKTEKDCWYVYSVEKEESKRPDQTIEIIMMKVDTKVMDMFTQAHGLTAREITQKSGIAYILPDAEIDDWLFEPCGYSMNALLPGGVYFTIHVTPEEIFSYASFETNAPMATYTDLIKKVTGIFNPGKFIVTFMSNRNSIASDYSLHDENLSDDLTLLDHQSRWMKNYKLDYVLLDTSSPEGIDEVI